MTTTKKVVRRKPSLSQLASDLPNGSETCRQRQTPTRIKPLTTHPRPLVWPRKLKAWDSPVLRESGNLANPAIHLIYLGALPSMKSGIKRPRSSNATACNTPVSLDLSPAVRIGPESDVDVLVDLKQPVSLLKFFALNDELETALRCKVDLVTRNSLNLHVKPFALRELQTVYEEVR